MSHWPTARVAAPFVATMLLAAVALADVPATQPASRPQLSRRQEILAEQAALPRREPVAVGTFVGFKIEDGWLRANLLRPGEDEYAVAFPDWPGFVTVRQWPREIGFVITHDVLSDNDKTETITQVLANPASVTISRESENARRMTSVQLIQNRIAGQDNDPVLLIVTESDGDEHDPAARPAVPPVRLSAATFADLCREQPAAVRQHLLPIFRDLGAGGLLRGSDPARAWQAIGALTPPDAAMNETIDALLQRIAGDDFADRAKAEESLARLGVIGATELRRRDLSKLDPDARSAAENAIRQAEILPADRAAELASDVPFLIDTLRLGDAKLMTAAAKQLATVTGKPIDLPADLPAAERDKRIDAYAASVTPTTGPTERVSQP